MVMERQLVAARAVPPGAILRMELEARGWSQRDLAQIVNRPVQAITEIVKGTKQVTPETALSLAAAFGTSPELWSNLESNYRLALARGSHSVDEVSRRARLFSWLPVRELVSRGWVEDDGDVESLERSICSFMGVKKVGDEPRLSVNLRKSCTEEQHRAAMIVWLRRVEQVAADQVLEPFSAKVLLNSIPSILRHAETTAGISSVPKVLAKLGVRFVVVGHVQKTKLDGAAAFPKGGPIVALTMRYDRIDYFWFTLLHELAHLALEHRGGHLDVDLNDGEIDTEEQEANQLASKWLVPDAELRTFAKKCRGKISRAELESFSSQWRVHPGITVGRLQHLKLLEYSHFRGMTEKVRHLLLPWTDGAC